MNHKAKHFWNNLKDGDITNWELFKIFQGETKCCCGTPIKQIIVLQHKTTKEQKQIGCDCASKLGIKLTWKTKSSYLGNAFLMCRNPREQQFVRGLQDKLPKWKENLIITEKQKKWLEGITNHNYKWKTWEVVE